MPTSFNLFFSVIIPTYNRAGLITETLESFVNQTNENFEVIIIDDGGNDNTEEIVQNLNDSRFKYFKKENGERGAARNFGAKNAEGIYLNFFDSDDIAYPNHLEQACKAVTILDVPMVFHLGMEMKAADGAIIFQVKNSKKDKIFLSSYITPNSVFVHRDAFAQVQYCEDRGLAGTEDWLFHLQLASKFKFIAFDKLVTSAMRQHDERSMTTNTGENVLQRSNLLKKYLMEDADFMRGFSAKLNVINAEMLSLTGLYMAINKKNLKVIKYLIKAFSLYPAKLFTRRFLAIIKIMLRNTMQAVVHPSK